MRIVCLMVMSAAIGFNAARAVYNLIIGRVRAAIAHGLLALLGVAWVALIVTAGAP